MENLMSINPTLPQHDEMSDMRRTQLAKPREDYQYSYSVIEGLALASDVPQEAAFSAKYFAERAGATASLLANLAALKGRQLFDPLDKLQDYEDFYPVLPDPTSIDVWRKDEYFAECRLSGPNPMTLCRVTDEDQVRSLAVSTIDESHLKIALGRSTTWRSAIDQGLFLVDYSQLLSHIHTGTFENGRKFVPEPIALFQWKSSGVRGRGRLMPVVIQVATSSGKFRVLTPKDPVVAWEVAKTSVQIADANFHEMSTHLGRTHFAMEPIAVSTARQLAPSHPVHILLAPHLRFLIANNHLGVERLINVGGPVDELLGGSISESVQIAVNSVKSWSIKEHAFEADLSNRGVNDSDVLPHYPFRDDGRLLHDSLARYVKSYLEIYYPTVTEIQEDYEIQGWAHELASSQDQKGGMVGGMPHTIDSVESLGELLTTIIFTNSVQHSAVNFAQWDGMGFIPNMPLAGYGNYMEALDPAHAQPLDMDFYMRLLPPNKAATSQVLTMRLLTSYHYDRLGDYDEAFEDPKAQSVHEIFQQDLNDIERSIKARNKVRQYPYLVLLPSEILNSISI
jgi:arachidonate 15-lipoxygenase